MKLSEIIEKSRKLVDKLKSNNDTILNIEDYFMLSVSLFIAKKESIIRKDSTTNTLYFDYSLYKNDYIKCKILIEEILKSSTIKINVPSLGEFDLTKTGCFAGIDNLIFPLGAKIEIENFNGSNDELNEVKRIVWIYSKIRDSFVHGNHFEFDFNNNLIKINNSISDDKLGSFDIKLYISPDILSFLCEENIAKNRVNNYYSKDEKLQTKNKLSEVYTKKISDFYFNNKYNDYDYDYNKNEKSIEEILGLIKEELRYLDDIQVLNELKDILNEYNRLKNKMSNQQRAYFFNRLLKLIKLYAKKNKLNHSKSRKLLDLLSRLLINENDYYCALYSHMIFIFSNIESVSYDNLTMYNFDVSDDVFKESIKKAIRKLIIVLDNLRDSNRKSYLNSEIQRDYVINEINDLLILLKRRNEWLLNKIRNGVAHKNINFEVDGYIEIFDRKDNRNDEDRDFECRISVENMDDLLKQIESQSQEQYELSVDDVIKELESIVGDMQSLDNVKIYLKTILDFLNVREKPVNL
ncbi:MAG: HEPN family nuclease [Bacilli bacterium]